VGTLPNESLAADLLSWLAPAEHWADLPQSVTVHSATNPAGRRIHVVHNWSWDPVEIGLPRAMTDLLVPGREAESLTLLELGSWDVRVLAE
jgi:beta-galactosidase